MFDIKVTVSKSKLNIPKNHTIEIVLSDKRQCPQRECLTFFDLLDENYDKQNERTTCPNCGHVANSKEFYTKEVKKEYEQKLKKHLDKINKKLFK